jgi:CDP-glucose 4,6-dehydratase
MGFLNIMISLSRLKKKCVGVLITSDKCYKNINKEVFYKETDTLGGIDPYSASKASSEILFRSFYETYLKNKNKFLTVCTARAGNVIGGGDWSEKRLIPDSMKSWLANKKILIRNPNATRPWQHVLEAVFGYLVLAEKMTKNKNLNGESFNFSSNKIKNVSVIKFLQKIKTKKINIKWKILKNKKFYESKLLQLNNKKAKNLLNWGSKLTLDETVTLVVEWYNQFKSDKKKIFNISVKQINFYFKK